MDSLSNKVVPMSAFRHENFLNGVRFWIQSTPHVTPKFQVYRYLGFKPDVGAHLFQAVRGNALIQKNHQQITQGILTGDFKPFLMDTARLTIIEQEVA